MKVMLVTGTRPQIIKSVPIIHRLMEADCEFDFIHTGQHYDDNMFTNFIEEFNIIEPYNLYQSGDAISLISGVMENLEHYMVKNDYPDIVIVPGDTNSALAAGLTALKLKIPFAHVEAGVRGWDMTLQEEHNRRILDHTASLLFCPTMTGYNNLIREEVQGKCYFTGDTNFDLFEQRYWIRANLKSPTLSKGYIVLTVHREHIVSNKGMLTNILSAVNALNRPVIFPIHPNTRQAIDKLDMSFGCIDFIEPVGYDHMMKLISGAKLVATDSGGLQKEAFFSGIPCVTFRTVTEWVETVKHGNNMLCDPNYFSSVNNALNQMYGRQIPHYSVGLFGDGDASFKIVGHILSNSVHEFKSLISTKRNT